MDIQKEKHNYLAMLVAEDAITQEQCSNLSLYNGGNYFHSDFLASSKVDCINWGFSAWLKAKAQAVPEWISVEDNLPKKNTNVLLNVVARRRGKPLVCVGFYSIEPDDDPCFVLDDNFTVLKGVTHWMMLPQPPKAQEQKG